MRSGPLPTEWSSQYFNKNLKIGSDGLTVSSVDSSLKSAFADGGVPYSGDCKIFLFEFEILEMEKNSEISFGVQDRSSTMNVHIGKEEYSLGIHLHSNQIHNYG